MSHRPFSTPRKLPPLRESPKETAKAKERERASLSPSEALARLSLKTSEEKPRTKLAGISVSERKLPPRIPKEQIESEEEESLANLISGLAIKGSPRGSPTGGRKIHRAVTAAGGATSTVVSPRRLSEQKEKEREREKEKEEKREGEKEKGGEKERGREREKEKELPSSVRCLLYKSLTLSALLAAEKHPLFKRIIECVEVIIVDNDFRTPLDVTFAQQFPNLRIIRGPYEVKESSGKTHFGFLTDLQNWTGIVKKGIKLSHLLFREDTALLAGYLPARFQAYSRDYIRILSKLAAEEEKSLNIGTYDLEWTAAGKMSKRKESFPVIVSGIYHFGVEGEELFGFVAAKQKHIIEKLWLPYKILKQGEEGVFTAKEYIEEAIKDRGLTDIHEVGISRFARDNTLPSLDIERIRKNYRGKLPLVVG